MADSAASPQRQRRNFAHKISKISAADAREKLSRALSESRRNEQGEKVSKVPPHLERNAPAYEAELTQLKDDIDRDPHPDLLRFPDQDWTVKPLRRARATEEDPLGSIDRGVLSPSTMACVEALTKDHVVFERRFAAYTQRNLPSRAELASGLCSHTFQVDHEDASSPRSPPARPVSSLSLASNVSPDDMVAEADRLVPDMLQYKRPESDERRASFREKTRVSVLRTADATGSSAPYDLNADVIPLNRLGDETRLPTADRNHLRFLVRCDSIDLPGQVEPLFMRVSLYDVQTRQRVSEEVEVDLNPEHIRYMIQEQHRDPDGPSSVCRQALFSLSQLPSRKRLADIFVVVKIDKVLDSDISKAIDYYTKSTVDDRSHDRQRTAAVQSCRRLGLYRMPLAWAATPLMSSHEQTRRLEIFLQQDDKLKDEDMVKNLLDLNERKTALKRARKLTGEMLLQVVEVMSDALPPNRLTSSMLHAKNFRSGSEPVQEAQEFFVRPASAPYTDYVHNLFVQPLNVNFHSTSHRNISCCVEFRTSSALNVKGQVSEAPKHMVAPTGSLVGRRFTSVSYHNKTPDFDSEFKVQLPPNTSDEHHLLFTFYHVSCKMKNDSSNPAKLIGYAWLPLARGGIFQAKSCELPVTTELPRDYCMNTNYQSVKGAKWLDGGKPLFSVKIRLVSSIQSHDLYLQRFLHHSTSFIAGVSTAPSASSLASAVRNLCRADEESVFLFMPVVLRQLLALITTPSKRDTEELLRDTFETLAFVVELAHSNVSHSSRAKFLESFVKYDVDDQLCLSGRLHTELTRNMINIMSESKSDKAQSVKKCQARCISRAWFFFEVIVKSMALHLHITRRSGAPRSERFPVEFVDDLDSLVHALLSEIPKDKVQPLERTVSLVRDVGFFVRDLLTLVDRGQGFRLVLTALRCLYENPQPALLVNVDTLGELRLEFLRVVCSHEHFVPLNLPLPWTLDGMIPSLSSPMFMQRHFLAALLVKEFEHALEDGPTANRFKGLRCLHELLLRHELDERLCDDGRQPQGTTRPSDKLSRVASLYLPVVALLCKYEPLLESEDAVAAPHNALQSPEFVQRRTEVELTEGERRGMLLLVTRLLRTIPDDMLRTWWKYQPKYRDACLDVARLAVITFSYPGRSVVARICSGVMDKGDVKKTLEGRYAGGGVGITTHRRQTSAGNELDSLSVSSGSVSLPSGRTVSSLSAQAAASRDNLRESMQSMSGGAAARKQTKAKTTFGSLTGEQAIDLAVQFHANLCTEASLTTLDVIETVLGDFNEQLQDNEGHNELMLQVFQCIVALMSTEQSLLTVKNLFLTLQGFVNRFPSVLYAGSTEFCGTLCEEVLWYCNSPLQELREQATAFLYLLLRKNFEHVSGSQFSRTKVQTTIALSKIVSSITPSQGNSDSVTDLRSHKFGTDKYLRKALATLILYASQDRALKETLFPKGVKDLSVNLYTILRDTSQIHQHSGDRDAMVALYCRIADGYRNSPDLRLTWLMNLGTLQQGMKQYQEAAMCFLHAGALIAEYLHLTEVRQGLPAGCAAFQAISLNVLDESAVDHGADQPHREGVCTHPFFSSNGLCQVLHKAIACFTDGNLHESANQVYDLLIPVYTAERNYQVLIDIHESMAESFKAILMKKRFFGTYFRVAFYGDVFDEDVRDKQFIYKRSGLTKLPEIVSELEEFYRARHGSVIERISHSNRIKPEEIKPDKGYIQVTFVQPWFPDHEVKHRMTDYDRNVSLNEFVYETPFTQSGKAHGSIEDQMMLKTYLRVEKSFPFLQARQEVADTREETLNPIEVATENLLNSVQELERIIINRPIDVKLLQLRLQGSVSVSVNEGPAKVAEAFFGPGKESKYQKRQLRKLRQAFGRFIKICGEALEMNKKLAADDQQQYHQSLESSFMTMKKAIVALTQQSSRASRASGVSGAGSQSSMRVPPSMAEETQSSDV